MCTSILPGPKEQNPDQIQRFLRPIISDLLHLWKFGIRLPTESCPQGKHFNFVIQTSIADSLSGWLIRVILVAVVCDKPAAHKIGGFASHSHTNFCTCCWIKNEDRDKPQSFEKGGAHGLIMIFNVQCSFL
jgi:hypothetical protein